MRFLALSVIEISSLIIGLVTALIAAWRGMHYWSLVISSLSTSFVYVVGYGSSAAGYRAGRSGRQECVACFGLVGI